MTIAEAANDISLADYSSWSNTERIVINVATLYREFARERGAAQPSASIAELFGLMSEIDRRRRN